jgi:hypothetical protein
VGYGLNKYSIFMSLPNLYVEVLTPKIMVSEGGAFERGLD